MKIKYILLVTVLGLMIGFGIVLHNATSAKITTVSPQIEVKKVGSGMSVHQADSGAANLLGSFAGGPKKGDEAQGLQAGPQSVDELIGKAEIKIGE